MSRLRAHVNLPRSVSRSCVKRRAYSASQECESTDILRAINTSTVVPITATSYCAPASAPKQRNGCAPAKVVSPCHACCDHTSDGCLSMVWLSVRGVPIEKCSCTARTLTASVTGKRHRTCRVIRLRGNQDIVDNRLTKGGR